MKKFYSRIIHLCPVHDCCMVTTHSLEGDHRTSRLHHWVLLVVLHQVCQRVKVLPSTNLILVFLQTQQGLK